ncbi:MAG: type II secretion system F family protein [Candidatus Aenigmarchaeota archaeon]|nr:type II secretion system F family protein [Candidatus Aenigmarchaeota archaeon]MDW8149020.1 type II secretion system F family protein [Candidatus Aenigmarchaeota archaeon]
MGKLRIPFLPFPIEKTLKFSRGILFLSNNLLKFFPGLQQTLIQAGIDLKDREYLSIAIFSSIFWFFVFFMIFILLSKSLTSSFLASFFLQLVIFFYISFYPRYLVSKRNRDIEKNLLFAVKHLLIQVKSGVSLFDAIVSVSKGNYGEISKEFEKCGKEIYSGKDQIIALEDLTIRNPNIAFRRVVWQLINAMRTGTDLGNSLEVMANNLSNEQRIAIRKYGSELSPIALMYLMTSIIFPTLGIVFLIIFSSFSGVTIPQSLFYIVIFSVAIFQFVFLGMIKSKRPSVEV